jgi:hypothetical protein
VTADLDTLLTALCRADRPHHPFPWPWPARAGQAARGDRRRAGVPGVAQVLLRYDDERHWLRAAASRIGHLFPKLLGQSEYNQRIKAAAPLMEAALRWLADQAPGSAEMLRLKDATPVPCGQSAVTARRHRPPFWPVRVGRIRLLSQPFTLVLGDQADAHRDLRWDVPAGGTAPMGRTTESHRAQVCPVKCALPAGGWQGCPRWNRATRRWMALISARGLPSTARMSASKPGASRPLRSARWHAAAAW